VIKSFTDLEAWRTGHKFVVRIYVVTKKFPKDEIYGITSQLRRAVVSVTSNIAEGFSRKSKREKTQFYCMSLGSLTETQNLLAVCLDVGYLLRKDFNELGEETVQVSKLINGLIKSAQVKQ
jgi:four helix bundle protein